NIKITSKGLVYLVDFGLAKIVRGSAKTATGAQGLTPGFSPPEQYGTARTDARSDIYSLGATLYKALTGSSPEDSLSRMMHQTELVSIRDRNPKISLQLSACIALALDVIPDERYQTAGEFRSALLQLSEAAQQQVAGGSITIPVDAFQADLAKTVKSSQAAEALTRGAGSEAGQAKKKSGAAWKWIAGLAFGVLGAYILLPGLFSTPPPPATPTSEITAVPSPDAAQGALGDASPQVIATPVPPVDATPTTAPTPTGSGGRIAFASFRPDRSNTGLPQVWLVNVAGGDLFQLTDEVGGACQPDWSPDGSKLVFVSPCEANQETYPGASLFVINADGSGRTALPTFLGGDFDPTWSPDGSKIAFTSIRGDRRRQIWLLDIASGAVTNISASVATDFQPAWSPDGAMLLFVTNRAGPTQVWFMDISGRPWDVFSRSNDKSNTDPVWSPDGSIILFTQRNSENQIGLTAALWENGGVNRGFNEFYIISDERQRNRYQMREVDFSPDGFWLVSAANPERNNFDLYIMTATGSQLTRLTTDPADDFDPAWQPAQ
ncbi:MAG: protein kinase, partial [Anaerolineae bacterium]|nr:protein kinase [Anaerolineae bacterium]